jgi:hypothetical protein
LRHGATGGTGFKPQAGHGPGIVGQPVQGKTKLTGIIAGFGQVGVNILQGCCQAVQRTGQFLEASS